MWTCGLVRVGYGVIILSPGYKLTILYDKQFVMNYIACIGICVDVDFLCYIYPFLIVDR